MDDAVRKYMAEMGRKGGKAGKGTKWRREVCRHAAIVRWRMYRERKRREYEKEQEKKNKKREEREALIALSATRVEPTVTTAELPQEESNPAEASNSAPVSPEDLIRLHSA